MVRRDHSRVELRRSAEPVSRYLDDARTLAKTESMPEELRRELVATCCRNALEAAAHAKVRAVRLGRGERHTDVEDALSDADTQHRVSELWGTLSRAGHHHHYELSPTAAELRGWLIEARTLVTRLEEAGR